MSRPLGMRWLLWRSRRPYVRQLDAYPLLVMPGVLDPVATKVGAWLAEKVAAEARPGERWLDMGCGTGVVGLALAAAGAEVTCSDIDPRCVRNARANAELAGLRIHAVQADLFEGLGRFDRVVFNLPFWPGSGEGRPFGTALYAGPGFALVHRFVREFPAHATGARVVLSEHGGDFAGARAALGGATVTAREKVRGEWLDLFALSPARRW